MESLDRCSLLNAEALSAKDYVRSLIQQACSCGLLSDKEQFAVQTRLLLLLAEQTDKWSQGRSSSIPTEKAQAMMKSILFVIGVQLKTCSMPEQALEQLKSTPLNVLFEEGLKLVHRKTICSRRLQKAILEHLLDTPNVYYRSTIADGISGFFKLYRPQFSAHEIHITADYPTFMGRPELDGIEFIEKYLQHIRAENDFCMCFASRDIHHLLCGLTQDYRSVPLNIFEPVLLSALGLVLQERSPKHLDLTQQDVSLLYQRFSNQSEKHIEPCIMKALFSLNRVMHLPQASMRYALLCIPKLAAVILHAVKTDTLDKVFLIPSYPENEPQLIFSQGTTMTDRAYQNLVEKIIQADNSEEKVALILNQVHGLTDFLDIVSDAELRASELDLLIDRVSLPVFVMLLAQYPDDDFLNSDSEQRLFASLQKRKQQLSAEEHQQVERLLRSIQKDEA